MSTIDTSVYKPLLINVFSGAVCYYFVSQVSYLSKDIFYRQTACFATSTVCYAMFHANHDKQKALTKIEMIPLTMYTFSLLHLYKDPSCLKIYFTANSLLYSIQVAVFKGSVSTPSVNTTSTPSVNTTSTPRVNKTLTLDTFSTEWLSNCEITDYALNYLKTRYKNLFFEGIPHRLLPDEHKKNYTIIPCVNTTLDNLLQRLERLKEDYPLMQHSFISVYHRGHYVLVYYSPGLKEIRYYDSKMKYGNHREITDLLRQHANKQDYTFSEPIKQILQPDSYQCVVWCIYMIDQLMKNPNHDFNTLKVPDAQEMIRKFREDCIPYFNYYKNRVIGV